jgi:hypothetical protein
MYHRLVSVPLFHFLDLICVRLCGMRLVMCAMGVLGSLLNFMSSRTFVNVFK